jgi:spore coat protein A
MVTRRSFLKYTGATTLTLFAAGRLGLRRAIAQIEGGTLSPLGIPKYATPLLIPPVMPRAGFLPMKGGQKADYYEISVKQFAQQILPAGLPPTTAWGYGAISAAARNGLLIHNAPSLTIEAQWKRPVRIKWINDLKQPNGEYLPHLLGVDPTLHWANPPGGMQDRDTRPTFTSTPGRYTGPVPLVTHVHGAVGVGDESDGYAEAWYLPAATNIPAGFASEGTWFEFFRDKAQQKFGAEWGPGFAVFQYPNAQRAATLWYHDHSLGMTRLNVYAGPAGFFIIRGGPDGDKAVLDSRTGFAAVLPGPAPIESDRFPPNKTYFEIPVAIQDRSFNSDGSLFYPDTRAFFDKISGPYIPETDISPLWNPEFFGNCMMVNGNTWPFLDVQQRRYRFRYLNGCNSRFLILDFTGIPGVEVWQVGNEGGFLAAPVNMTAANGNKILLGPAERADVIVDFTNVPLGSFTLANIGPDEPFGGGIPGEDFDMADPATTGQIMQFRVGPALAPDLTTPPQFLLLPAITTLTGGTTRSLALVESMSTDFEDAPAEALLGTLQFEADGDGEWTAAKWSEPVTENPQPGATETWEFFNATADAHPMHIHEVAFQVVDRQPIIVDEDDEEVRLQPGSGPTSPEPWEIGWKDTVIAYPNEVTRVRMTFETAGQFVWHCHIVEHEDNEMMRPYRIGPMQAGQPAGHAHAHAMAAALSRQSVKQEVELTEPA